MVNRIQKDSNRLPNNTERQPEDKVPGGTPWLPSIEILCDSNQRKLEHHTQERPRPNHVKRNTYGHLMQDCRQKKNTECATCSSELVSNTRKVYVSNQPVMYLPPKFAERVRKRQARRSVAEVFSVNVQACSTNAKKRMPRKNSTSPCKRHGHQSEAVQQGDSSIGESTDRRRGAMCKCLQSKA